MDTKHLPLKTVCDGEVRRFAAPTASFEEFHDAICAVHKVEADAEIILRYADEDGDHVTMSTKRELDEAIHCAGSSYLRVYVQIQEKESKKEVSQQADSGVDTREDRALAEESVEEEMIQDTTIEDKMLTQPLLEQTDSEDSSEDSDDDTDQDDNQDYLESEDEARESEQTEDTKTVQLDQLDREFAQFMCVSEDTETVQQDQLEREVALFMRDSEQAAQDEEQRMAYEAFELRKLELELEEQAQVEQREAEQRLAFEAFENRKEQREEAEQREAEERELAQRLEFEGFKKRREQRLLAEQQEREALALEQEAEIQAMQEEEEERCMKQQTIKVFEAMLALVLDDTQKRHESLRLNRSSQAFEATRQAFAKDFKAATLGCRSAPTAASRSSSTQTQTHTTTTTSTNTPPSFSMFPSPALPCDYTRVLTASTRYAEERAGSPFLVTKPSQTTMRRSLSPPVFMARGRAVNPYTHTDNDDDRSNVSDTETSQSAAYLRPVRARTSYTSSM